MGMLAKCIFHISNVNACLCSSHCKINCAATLRLFFNSNTKQNTTKTTLVCLNGRMCVIAKNKMHIAQKWQTAKLFMLSLNRNLQRFCHIALQIICSQPMYNILSKFCFCYVLHVCTFRIFAFCPSHLAYFHLHTFQTTMF